MTSEVRIGGRDHWDTVYDARAEEALTWFEPEARLSLELIGGLAGPADGIIDVGGGASRLVDGLLNEGYGDVAVLDLSPAALAVSKDRLGTRADAVQWIAADITHRRPDRRWRLWHDRAVFHFLTDEADRRAYFRALSEAVEPGGHAIIATFSPEGPETCSGLPVHRWSGEALAGEAENLAPGLLERIDTRSHVHKTPKGNSQAFQISRFLRR